MITQEYPKVNRKKYIYSIKSFDFLHFLWIKFNILFQAVRLNICKWSINNISEDGCFRYKWYLKSQRCLSANLTVEIRISIEKDKSEPVPDREKVRIIFACPNCTKKIFFGGFASGTWTPEIIWILGKCALLSWYSLSFRSIAIALSQDKYMI